VIKEQGNQRLISPTAPLY